MSGPNGGPIGNLPGAAVDLSNVTPVAPVDFNAQRIVNVANPVNPQDVVTKDYFDNNPPSGVANDALSNILPTASVSFNGQKLVGVANPTNPQDVVTLDYFDNNPPSGLALSNLSNINPSASVDFNSQKLVNVADPTNPQDVVTLAYFGSNVAGGATRQLDNLTGVNINADLSYQTGNVGAIWTIETPDNPGFSAASLYLRTGGSTVGFQSNIDIRTGPVYTGSNIQSGDVIIATGPNTQANSALTGDVNVSTGTKTVASGLTGAVFIRTGSTSHGGVNSDSGAILIESGSASGSGDSGSVTVQSNVGGNNGTSGTLNLRTGGNGVAGSISGPINMNTGIAGASSGPINIATGGSNFVNSGPLNLQTGQAPSGNSGAINIETSATAVNRGSIFMRANKVDMSNTDNGLVIPKIAGDPATPVDGEMWYNTTLNKFRVRENGVTVNLI